MYISKEIKNLIKDGKTYNDKTLHLVAVVVIIIIHIGKGIESAVR